MQKSRRIYRKIPDRDFPHQWRDILKEKVAFYQKLTSSEKQAFEYQVHVFLLNVQIIGIKTKVTDLDKILISSGGVIPTFKFTNWHYFYLQEVYLYPDKFTIPNTDTMANGLVGWGHMEGKMLLSRKAIYHGFSDQSDNKNVALHEFIHLIDKQDGDVDGIVDTIMSADNIDPWIKLSQQKAQQIVDGDSSIRDYASTNRAEFLAAVGEVYFENPQQLRSDHPGLYNAMESLFNPVFKKEIVKSPRSYKRKGHTTDSENCPCGSGERFMDCCKRNAYNQVEPKY